MTNSTQTAVSRVGAVLIVGAALALHGCSGEPPDSPRTEFVIPDQFESDGNVWSHNGAMSDDDLNFLSRFFRMSPELGDSPELRGSPAVFANAAIGRRYYWVRNAGEQVSWYCIGIEDGSIAVTEGNGSPF